MAALPNTGITTSMVANAIGAASNDVGTLCSHSNVNKWAKHKPIEYNKVTGLSEQDFINANYGLSAQEDSQIKTYQWCNTGTLAALIYPSEWVYNKPQGGSSSPYRLGDFREYNHYAASPIADINDIEVTQQNVDEYLNGTNLTKFWYPSFRFGSQSYQVVGNVTPDMEIPFYNFTLISGSTITDGNWRICLGIFKDGKFYIATSESPFLSNLGSSEVYKVFVDLFKYTQVRNLIFNLPFDTTLKAIPFFGYKLKLDTNQDGWYFDTSYGSRGFYFPLGNVIDITKIEYLLDLKVRFMTIATSNESGIFQGTVSFDSSASVQGNLYNIKAPSPTAQKLFLRTDGVTGTVKIDLDKTGTRLQFQKTNQEWINLPIESINDITSGEVTLNTGSSSNVFITEANEALKTYLGSLNKLTDPGAHYKGGLRLLAQEGNTVKVYGLSKIGDNVNKWFQYNVIN